MPSTPALPLLAFTCRNASFRFSRSHTSSINRSVLAGLSGPFVAIDDSVSSPATPRAAPVSAEEKSSSIWIFCCRSSVRLMACSPLLLVRAFSVAGCRVGGGALTRWPPSAAQTARTVFPYAAFTKTPPTETQTNGNYRVDPLRARQVDPGHQYPQTMMYGFFAKRTDPPHR